MQWLAVGLTLVNARSCWDTGVTNLNASSASMAAPCVAIVVMLAVLAALF